MTWTAPWWIRFVRHIVENEPYKWILPEGAKGVQLVEAALESWKERRWVGLPALHISYLSGMTRHEKVKKRKPMRG